MSGIRPHRPGQRSREEDLAIALSRVKTWSSGETLTASDLNAEFNNTLNNSLAMISPLTGNLAVGGNDVTGFDEIEFNDASAGATAVGRLRMNVNSLSWHDRTGAVNLGSMPQGHLFGCTLSNDATDPTNDIGIAVGVAVNSTGATMLRLTTALIKQLDAAWAVGTNAGGLDTGSIANTTYHVHLIQRVDTGVVDVLYSTSATAPTMPTSYTLRRRIGSILREGAAIVLFTQDGNYFRRTTPILDIDSTNPGTAAVTRTLSVPLGVNVHALYNAYLIIGASGSACYLSDLAAADAAASRTVAPLGTMMVGSASADTEEQVMTRTNTSAAIRSRLSVSDGSVILRIATLGWIDKRGRDA